MKDRHLGYLFLAPTALAMLLVFVYPLFVSLWSSLHYDVFTQPARYGFVGAQNYLAIVKDALFWNALRNSMNFFVATVTGTMVGPRSPSCWIARSADSTGSKHSTCCLWSWRPSWSAFKGGSC